MEKLAIESEFGKEEWRWNSKWNSEIPDERTEKEERLRKVNRSKKIALEIMACRNF